MAQNLLEAYKNRLNISESVYAKAHCGEKMDSRRKLCTAKLLENTNKFLNEAFENSVGTQRADMGLFKKFTLWNWGRCTERYYETFEHNW